MLRGLAFFLFFTIFSATAFGRTWPTTNYHKDPGANINHEFGIYKDVKHYKDPDFDSALQITSPFADPRFETYDVAVIINIKNTVDPLTKAAIKGQTIRTYARESLLAKIPTSNLQATRYDANTGLLFYWKTSTARAGKYTPRGWYRPQSFSSDHKSSLYNNSPMPWTVFFNGSIATHGTDHVEHLGQIASAGCARLEPQRGEDLFNLIGIAGRDWVDKIDTGGKLVYTTDGQIIQEENFKTLIVVQ